MSNPMDDLLNNLDDAYKDAPSEGFELPSGKYVFHIKAAEICKSNSSDRIHVKMQLIVVDDSKYKNADHWSYDLRFTNTKGEPDMKGMMFFKQACQAMDITPPSSISDAPEAVAQMVDRVIEADVVVKGDFRNTRIRKLVHDNYLRWIDAGCPMNTKTTDDSGW